MKPTRLSLVRLESLEQREKARRTPEEDASRWLQVTTDEELDELLEIYKRGQQDGGRFVFASEPDARRADEIQRAALARLQPQPK